MNTILAAVLIGSVGAAAMDVSVEEGARTTRVEAAFTAEATCSTAWRVLSDYDRLEEFVGSMKESSVERLGGVILVTQRATTGFLLAAKQVTVRLRIEETPGVRIEFVDLADEDFDWYAGAWSLAPSSGGCVVRYELQADRRFRAPKWLSRRVAQRSVRAMLADVKAEIERRP